MQQVVSDPFVPQGPTLGGSIADARLSGAYAPQFNDEASFYSILRHTFWQAGIDMTGQSVLLAVGALLGVMAMIAVTARFLRFGRWGGQRGAGRTLALQESIALDPRRRVHLVKCGQRQVVLLTGGGQDLVIGWVQDQ